MACGCDACWCAGIVASEGSQAQQSRDYQGRDSAVRGRGGSRHQKQAGTAFTDSVQPEIGKMLEDVQPQILQKNDPKVENVFRMVYTEILWPGESLEAMRPWQYFLMDDRPAVFFSPNDDGCGWEISTPPSASNPIGEGIGHGGGNSKRERFYKWMTNWMIYVYCH